MSFSFSLSLPFSGIFSFSSPFLLFCLLPLEEVTLKVDCPSLSFPDFSLVTEEAADEFTEEETEEADEVLFFGFCLEFYFIYLFIY